MEIQKTPLPSLGSAVFDYFYPHMPDSKQWSLFSSILAVNPLFPALFLFLDATFWYVIFCRVFKHKMAVSTSAPIRRILSELLYIKGGPNLLMNTIFPLIGACWFIASFLLILPLAALTEGLPEPVITVLALGYAFLVIIPTFSMLLGPNLVYNTLMAKVLFGISVRRAVILSIVASLFATALFAPYRVYSNMILPFQMSEKEITAITTIHAIAQVNYDFGQRFGRRGTLEELEVYAQKEVEHGTGSALMHKRQFEKVARFQRGVVGGYRFTMEIRGKRVFVRAVPESWGSETTYTFFGELHGYIWATDIEGAHAGMNNRLVFDLPFKEF